MENELENKLIRPAGLAAPEPKPYPEGRKPLLPPSGDPAFKAGISKAFNGRNAIAAAIEPADLEGDTCAIATVLGNGRIIGSAVGCPVKIAVASLIPRNGGPVILWGGTEGGIRRHLEKGRMIIPVRTLYEDFLQKDFSDFATPSEFFNELRENWQVKADPLPWPDTFPGLSENGDYTMKILAHEAMTLHLLASKLLEGYYRITP